MVEYDLTTNYEAEYEAMVTGLELESDSQLVVNQIQGGTRSSGATIPS